MLGEPENQFFLTRLGLVTSLDTTQSQSGRFPFGITSLGPLALIGLLLSSLPAVTQAQFNYSTNNGTITITGYTGPRGAMVIPDTINGLPVTDIEWYAFNYYFGLTDVSIPNSVTSIGSYAFLGCSALTNVSIGTGVTNIGFAVFYTCSTLAKITVDPSNSVYNSLDGVVFRDNQTLLFCCPEGKIGSYAVPNGVSSIGDNAFQNCGLLTSLTIPNGVTNIGNFSFFGCSGVTNVTIAQSVSNIGGAAFGDCLSLAGLYCEGDAPTVDPSTFLYDNNVTVYYLPDTRGWSNSFAGAPTAPWRPLIRGSAGFGAPSRPFGFVVSWSGNRMVVVEACTDLAHPVWLPLLTNVLTGGTAYLTDSESLSYPVRLYRVRSP